LAQLIVGEIYGKEERLFLPLDALHLQYKHLVVVSGYGGPPMGQGIQGSDDGDDEWVPYVFQIVVGPIWRKIHDVSPIALINHLDWLDFDETDKAGQGVNTCSWTAVSANGGERIQLQIELNVRGGTSSFVGSLGYQLTATGDVLSDK
jgi:hypothetical protein